MQCIFRCLPFGRGGGLFSETSSKHTCPNIERILQPEHRKWQTFVLTQSVHASDNTPGISVHFLNDTLGISVHFVDDIPSISIAVFDKIEQCVIGSGVRDSVCRRGSGVRDSVCRQLILLNSSS